MTNETRKETSMTSTATTEFEQLLDQLEEPAAIPGDRALSDVWVLLGRVPKDDPIYPHVEALMTVTDAMLRDTHPMV